MSTLPGLKTSSVLIAHLDDAGVQLDGHLAVLLDDVVMRPEKAILPLPCESFSSRFGDVPCSHASREAIASPLLALWTSSLERTLARASLAPDGQCRLGNA